MAKNDKVVASVLAFEKKLVPSDGYLYGTNWDKRNEQSALKLIEKSVRGTISNRLK
ncbi:type I-F CRISPR-associated protein Cas7f/Csy3, partial [Acinetobacter sp. Colony158]